MQPQAPTEYEYDTDISAGERRIVENGTMDEGLATIKRFTHAWADGGSGLTIIRVRELADMREAHD